MWATGQYLNAIFACGVSDISVPLATLLDFRGGSGLGVADGARCTDALTLLFADACTQYPGDACAGQRVMAASVLPIGGADTLVYGSRDQGMGHVRLGILARDVCMTFK